MCKRFFKIIFITLSLIIFVCIFNYYSDVYGIFREKYINVLPINERYIKTKYLLNNKEKYDSFILGSSRVGFLKGENIVNGNYYNMTLSVNIPYDSLQTLRLLLENNIKIKNIILGLDDFSFSKDPKEFDNDLLRMSYSKVNKGFNKYKFYLFRNPFSKMTLQYFSKKYKIYSYDIYNTGKWSYSIEKDNWIENNIEEHKKLSIFKYQGEKINTNNRIENTLKEIRQIINLCEIHKIKLTVILLPLEKNTYLSNDQNYLKEIKSKLASITDYWDFIQLNEYTENPYYWYENSHYRPILGDIILKKIFKEEFNLTPKLKVDENFGIFIKKQNYSNIN